MKKILLLFSFSIFIQLFAQNSGNRKIDSLQNLIKNAKSDSLKIHHQFALCDLYRAVDAKKAVGLRDELDKKIKTNHHQKHRLIFLQALILMDEGKYEESLNNIEKSIRFFSNPKHKNDTLLSLYYNSLAINYQFLGEYDTSIKNHLKSITFSKKTNNVRQVGVSHVNLGFVYFDLKEFEKSKKHYYEALKNLSATNSDLYIAMVQGNLSSIFFELKEYDSSKIYAEKAIDYFTKNNQLRYKSYPMTGLARTQTKLKEYKKAEKNFLESIEIKWQNKDYKDWIITKGYLADMYLELGKLQEAEQNALEAYNKAKEMKILPQIEESTKILARIYEKNKDFENATHFYKLNQQAKDSLFITEKSKESFRLQTKYETAEKENKILEQENQLQSRKLWMVRIAAVAVIVGLLGLMFFFKQRHKIRQQKKENELKLALSEIENQNKLQEQRLAISRDLHDNIGSQLTFIISSIDTTKQFMGDKDEKINARLSKINAFTRETISELRDTIWAMNNSEITIENLYSRILNFINNAGIATDEIDFQFQNKIKDSEVKLNSKNGMNVYRILQESVNNAIKHAKATRIETILSEETHDYILEIKDNGNGFTKEDVLEGNGLISMQKRAEDLGGTLQISSNENGTIVQLKIPKNEFKN